ncbi:TetR/AcrR family transcriptional regulator [Streptomyces calidiresistens]|uniref:TetR/AcrR family transcriptional regulator n=1 Tax=Streptomyces calidiresistens TaxID=1485586 RepID=UPI002B1FAA11|nr:TetR/AcrR family transcriptional regulator [Streptomyces calidiresistens]
MSAAPPERADAARNRRRILDAAARLLAERGPTGLAPDAVAREANVGVGTVYRRFGDRAGLVFALLEDRDARFRAGFDATRTAGGGKGTDGDPRTRLREFLHALVDLVVDHLDLLLVAESASPEARYAGRPYREQHARIRELITAIAPDADAEYLADALLATLAPGLVAHRVRERGFDPSRLKAGLDTLVGGIAAGVTPDREPPGPP